MHTAFGTGWEPLDAPPGFLVARRSDVAVLEIDRPAKRNAVTAAMWAALPGVLDRLVGTIRALIVTGAGDTFSAGADIVELNEVYQDEEAARAYLATNVAAESALAAFPHPTIAAVAGHCVGGGCQLAVACDLRLAARDAAFGVTPAKLGVVYPAVPTARLTRLLGPARAKYLLYSATLINSTTAYSYGLIDRIADDVHLAALELAEQIATRSPHSIGAAAAVIQALGEGRDPKDAMEPYERRVADAQERLAAFLDSIGQLRL